jgi:hypothetical protein
MIPVRCFLIVVLGLSAAAPAAAQHDVVPKEFVSVLLLLSGWEDPRSELHVGELSDMLHGIVPATDERVIGTVHRVNRATAAIAVRGAAADVHASWERRLETAGWRPNTRSLDSGRGGFVPAQEPARAPIWCWPEDDTSISLSSIDAPGDETYIVFSITAGPRTWCGELSSRPMLDARPPMFDRLPALPAPAGTRVFDSGLSGSGNSVTQQATLHTGLTVPALLEHYAAAMRRQGWEPVDGAVGETVAMSVWRTRGDDGRTMTAWITGAAQPDDIVAMELTIRLGGGS